MTRLFVLFGSILVCICVGCGSDEPDRTTANIANNQAPNTADVSSWGNSSLSNTANVSSPGNSSLSNTSSDPGTANSAPENPASALRNKKLKDIRAAGGDPSAPKPDVEAVLKGSERPAPEDSLFAVALVDNVIERRIFLKHPTLKMVEKVTTNDGRSSLKVMTRDGRSFDLDGNAIGPVSTAASFTILRAIGLEGPTGGRKQRQPAESKKN